MNYIVQKSCKSATFFLCDDRMQAKIKRDFNVLLTIYFFIEPC